MVGDSIRSRAYHDLLEALSQEGCALCWLGQRVAEQYLDRLLYENVNDPGLRERIRAARGLCHRHAWALTEIRGSGLGIALIYRDVLHVVFQELVRDVGDEKRFLSWSLSSPEGAAQADRLMPQGPCPACAQQEEMERIYLHALLRHLDDTRLQTAFAGSAGLCLLHLRQALRQAEDNAQRKALLDLQGAIWRQLLAELDEFIRKNDYRFRGEGFGPEGDSWLRALASMSGNR